jgi:hypothetical protein
MQFSFASMGKETAASVIVGIAENVTMEIAAMVVLNMLISSKSWLVLPNARD